MVSKAKKLQISNQQEASQEGSVICKSSRGVTLVDLLRANRNRALEGCVVKGEVGWWKGDWKFGCRAWCFDTVRERTKRITDKMWPWEWACMKDVFAPTFSSAAQGGYSHCLEVFSCVPLGPTRWLVTHLKVSFSVVQHHLKNQCSIVDQKH